MKTLLPILSMLLLCSCNSSDAWDIFKSSGHTKTIERILSEFSSINVPENMEIYVYVQDSASKIVITAGKNLIPDIKSGVENGVLNVQDNNGYSIFRDNTRIVKLAIFTKQLRSFSATTGQNIHILSNTESDTLSINLPECSGDLSASLKSNLVRLTMKDATSKVTLLGMANTISYNSGQSFGPIDLSGIKAKTANLIQSGSNDITVNITDTLRLTISGIGNVIYSGNPIIISTITGKGKIIRKGGS